jgi:hypothetical protein
MEISSILWPLGTFCIHLVHFSGFFIMYQEKSGNPVVWNTFIHSYICMYYVEYQVVYTLPILQKNFYIHIFIHLLPRYIHLYVLEYLVCSSQIILQRATLHRCMLPLCACASLLIATTLFGIDGRHNKKIILVKSFTPWRRGTVDIASPQEQKTRVRIPPVYKVFRDVIAIKICCV